MSSLRLEPHHDGLASLVAAFTQVAFHEQQYNTFPFETIEVNSARGIGPLIFVRFFSSLCFAASYAYRL